METTAEIIIISFTMPLILAGILIWFVITYQKKKNEFELEKKDQKLREKELIIQRQQALTNERTRIAAEMHDDLGGGLTTIKFLSQKALRKINDPEQKIEVEKIVTNAQTLVNNMSEIIWAMNAGFDTLENLIAYCRRFSREYLDDHEVQLSFSSTGDLDKYQISGEERRNIFLVVKESLHNTIKHANATLVIINFSISDNHLFLRIQDNGIGLSNEVSVFGNGLLNMQKRIEMIEGSISFLSEDGLKVNIKLPLKTVSKELT